MKKKLVMTGLMVTAFVLGALVTNPVKSLAAPTPTKEYNFDGDLGGAKPMAREGDNEEGGNAGTLPTENSNANVTYVEGKNGQAVFLDGTFGLELDAVAPGETYSVAFWVNPERFSNFGPIFQTGSDLLSTNTSATWLNITKTDWDGDSCPIIWSRNEKTGAWPWYCTAYFTAGGGYQIPKKEWSHIVVTVDGKTTATDPATGDVVADTVVSKLYVNGQLIGEGPVATGTFQGDAKAYLGINCWDIIFKGAFDDVKVYDTVLTAAEAAELAGAEVPLTPVKKYSFDDSLDGAKVLVREGDNEDGGNAGTLPIEGDSAKATFVEGKNGKAISLDGSFGLLLDQPAIGETYTLAFWVNPARFSNFGPIIQLGSDLLSTNTASTWLNITKTDWDGDSCPIIWSRNEITGAWPWYCTAYFTAGGGYQIPKNEWSHIVVTVDGQTPAMDPVTGYAVPDTVVSKLYVNGTYVGEGPVATGTFAGDAKAYVGINCWDIIFKGLFDDIELYDTVLTEEQIATLVGASVEATPEPTVALEPTATPAPTQTQAPTATIAPTEAAVETSAEAGSVSPVVIVVIVVVAVAVIGGVVFFMIKKKNAK